MKVVVQVRTSVLVVVELKVERRGPQDPRRPAACEVNGGPVGQGIELEGDVSSGNSAAFQMAVNGRAGSA